jgi:hypothetical protein
MHGSPLALVSSRYPCAFSRHAWPRVLVRWPRHRALMDSAAQASPRQPLTSGGGSRPCSPGWSPHGASAWRSCISPSLLSCRRGRPEALGCARKRGLPCARSARGWVPADRVPCARADIVLDPCLRAGKTGGGGGGGGGGSGAAAQGCSRVSAQCVLSTTSVRAARTRLFMCPGQGSARGQRRLRQRRRSCAWLARRTPSLCSAAPAAHALWRLWGSFGPHARTCPCLCREAQLSAGWCWKRGPMGEAAGAGWRGGKVTDLA